MEKKYYQLATHTEAEWDELNAELSHLGRVSDYVPDRTVDCVDDQLHSPTRGTYLLTDTEAEQLKNDPRIKFINIDYKRYAEFTPPPDELHSVRPDLVNRYTAAVKNYREFEVSNTLAATPNNSDINRTGYQLYRCTQKLDPWVDNSLADNAVVNTNISQYGTGKNIDVIVADDGTWIGHPEFQNNSLSKSSPFAAVPNPSGYVGGNLLPGNGTCDLLDLVLDSPYYIDPDWFNAEPVTRLTTRWDGTRVPAEAAARSWWSNSALRSTKFANVGTVSVPFYSRADNNGTNAAISGEGDHGTCCAALTFGRTQGWAYNANKWVFNLYGGLGIGIEEGFDLTKIFHTIKPINTLFGSKDPTIMSNSWGYRSNKDPGGATYYYTHRATSNVAYTTEVGINWLSHMGTQGDSGRWKSEMKINSLTTAQDELITAGVIFVAASGNSNQKQVNSGHPDFNNYISTFNNLPLPASLFTEFGVQTLGTTNRRGFPQQGGMYNDVNGNRVYPVINIGALDDDYKTSKEAKVSYSDRGNSIDIYAPADGTLAANRSYATNWPRPDTYSTFSANSGNATDAAFNGTSAACPVATGFIATVLEWNRDWTWVEVKAWLQSLETQDAADFYFGTESTTVNTANWLDYESLEGGDPRVLYQGPFDARFRLGPRQILSNLNIPSGLKLKLNR